MENTVYLEYKEPEYVNQCRYALSYKNGLEINRFGNPKAAIDYAFKHGWVVEDIRKNGDSHAL